jgi:hypothetical protein
MAPVAGGIANGQEYGFVFQPRALYRLPAPWIPEYRIMRVLAQVRAGGIDQRVGKAGILFSDANGKLLI